LIRRCTAVAATRIRATEVDGYNAESLQGTGTESADRTLKICGHSIFEAQLAGSDGLNNEIIMSH
jgi:hypothetical protein